MTTTRQLLAGLALCSIAFVSAIGEETTKPEIKGGLPGKIVKVDVAQGTLTISTENGRDQTFAVTEQTVIVGPRGGLVKKRLNDPRFHQGLPITVVATGKNAAELHLGYDRKATKAKSTESASPRVTRKSAFRGATTGKSATAPDSAKSTEADEDEDLEFPGKIKSADATKRILVVTLLNGQDRSFLLSNDAKITVGRRTSKQGLADAAIKPGLAVTVTTEEGGRKVKEVKIRIAARRATKKAA